MADGQRVVAQQDLQALRLLIPVAKGETHTFPNAKTATKPQQNTVHLGSMRSLSPLPSSFCATDKDWLRASDRSQDLCRSAWIRQEAWDGDTAKEHACKPQRLSLHTCRGTRWYSLDVAEIWLFHFKAEDTPFLNEQFFLKKKQKTLTPDHGTIRQKSNMRDRSTLQPGRSDSHSHDCIPPLLLSEGLSEWATL